MGDLDEIDDTVKLGLEFVFAEKIQDVLDVALVKKPDPEDIPYEIVKPPVRKTANATAQK